MMKQHAPRPHGPDTQEESMKLRKNNKRTAENAISGRTMCYKGKDV